MGSESGVGTTGQIFRFWLGVVGAFYSAIYVAALLGTILFAAKTEAKDDALRVIVNDTFINLRSGPGRSYPIFYVVERDEIIALIKSRTNWIKIKTRRGLSGWINRADIQFTIALDGSKPEFSADQVGNLAGRWALGGAYGDFAGADSLTIIVGYQFTQNLSAELQASENTGQFADSQSLVGAVLFQPFPNQKISPFFSTGMGQITTYPGATLVQTEDRQDNMLQASIGSYIHIDGRLFLRVECTNQYILTSRNTNEEVNEWSVGFNMFF